MTDWMLTPNQISWLKEVIEDHRIAASNERLWAMGAPDAETAEMHFTNSAEHIGLTDILENLLEEHEHKEDYPWN